MNKQTRYQKAQVLLKEFIVRDVRVGNVSKFYKFLDVLKKNDKCSFLAENIMKDLGAAGTTQWSTTQDAYNLAHAYNTELGPGTFIRATVNYFVGIMLTVFIKNFQNMECGWACNVYSRISIVGGN